MKRKLFASLLVLILCFSTRITAEASIPAVNLDAVGILPAADAVGTEEGAYGRIQYTDGTGEAISQNYIGLFVNGNIIKNAGVVSENGKYFLPLRSVAEALGTKVIWEEKEDKRIIILDGVYVYELHIGSNTVKTNGVDSQVALYPKIINGHTYVTPEFFTGCMDTDFSFYDGETTEDTHIVLRLPHIMISRYGSETSLTREEAVEKARTALLTAFEKKYGQFVAPLEGEEMKKYDEKDYLRKTISNLKVVSENDRFYVIPVVYDFWVDKYTGDVYTFYNGLQMDIRLFDPQHPGALAFAG